MTNRLTKILQEGVNKIQEYLENTEITDDNVSEYIKVLTQLEKLIKTLHE